PVIGSTFPKTQRESERRRTPHGETRWIQDAGSEESDAHHLPDPLADRRAGVPGGDPPPRQHEHPGLLVPGDRRAPDDARLGSRRPLSRAPPSIVSIRRLAEAYDAPQIVTTDRRSLRRPADRYDAPQKLTTARRWLRRAAEAYDGPQ